MESLVASRNTCKQNISRPKSVIFSQAKRMLWAKILWKCKNKHSSWSFPVHVNRAYRATVASCHEIILPPFQVLLTRDSSGCHTSQTEWTHSPLSALYLDYFHISNYGEKYYHHLKNEIFERILKAMNPLKQICMRCERALFFFCYNSV